jgi:hypothetical protein
MRATTMNKQLLQQMSEMTVILWDERKKQRDLQPASLIKATKQDSKNTKARRGGPAHTQNQSK